MKNLPKLLNFSMLVGYFLFSVILDLSIYFISYFCPKSIYLIPLLYPLICQSSVSVVKHWPTIPSVRVRFPVSGHIALKVWFSSDHRASFSLGGRPKTKKSISTSNRQKYLNCCCLPYTSLVVGRTENKNKCQSEITMPSIYTIYMFS